MHDKSVITNQSSQSMNLNSTGISGSLGLGFKPYFILCLPSTKGQRVSEQLWKNWKARELQSKDTETNCPQAGCLSAARSWLLCPSRGSKSWAQQSRPRCCETSIVCCHTTRDALRIVQFAVGGTHLFACLIGAS